MNKTNSHHQSRYLPRFSLALLAPRYWLTWLLLLVFYVFSWLPIAVIDWMGGRLGDYAAKKNRKRLAIVQRNLQLCFPHMTVEEIDLTVRAHFRAYVRSILHYGLIWWAPDWRLRRHIELHGADQIQHYRAQGKNIIALTCHSVGLEFSVAALSMRELCGGPYKPMKNPLIDWLVAKGRMQNKARIFTREEGLRPLVRNTREGRILIYLADEDLGAEVSVFAPFFGVPKATIPVLGRLAKTCDAIVLPCISCYDEQTRKYNVRLMPALQNYPQGDDLADASNMNHAIEQAVMQCMPQYFWTMKWFRSRPAGEPEVYD